MLFEIYEGMVQILPMLKALFTLDDIFVKLLSALNRACSSAIISSGLTLDDFYYGFIRMTNEADDSVVLAEL